MRKIAVFVGVLIILGAGLVAGIMWLKSRSHYYASANTPSQVAATGASQEKSTSSHTTSASSGSSSANSNTSGSSSTAATSTPQVEGASTTVGNTPASVPETGPANILTTLVGIMAVTFSAIVYIQARRKLGTPR